MAEPLYVQDTIAALATPPGRGGVGIIRVSGPACAAIAEAVVGHCPPPRRAHYGPFRGDAGVIDEGIALYFAAPHSFTGENVLELQGHGGPVIMDLLLERCVHLGARLARPGEFSERAFLNDKLDLAQAEAIADLIDASSRTAAENALRSLQGEFSRRVEALVARLVELRMYVEAAIDFPEEEIDFLADGRVAEMLTGVQTELAEVLSGLVSGASAILLELSSGAYSLAVDDTGDFFVVDHRNADERRSARTLSGGETFLASLALALSLAEHLRELAVAATPRLESIFLDEGFGTLDPETLDVVAATVEELGASGRTVGLVTHVRELAERVPVRFEVRRGASGSVIERVDL